MAKYHSNKALIIMDQTIGLTEKKDFITEYVKLYKYKINNNFQNMKESDINEIYDLYKNNIMKNVITLNAWYGIYYEANKQYDKMFEHFISSVENNYISEDIVNILYLAMKNYTYDSQQMSRALKAVKKNKDKKLYDKFVELKKKKPAGKKQVMKVMTDVKIPNNKISLEIDSLIGKNEMDKINDLYDGLKDDLEKVQYLSKTMVMPNFKPTKNMIDDLIKLDFSNASTDIQLIKSIFDGINININQSL